MGDKLNKLHYSYSSSSSPSSSSSHHHPQQQPVPLNSTRSWDNQQQMGGNIYKEDNSNAASTKQNLMETSPRNDVSVTIDKEHMFDKVVTPSDVGKLNRLVIPKQYAEKYFPLDSTTNEKGLHLNFEDCNGKPWRFRYSYWNSSQSYVMTKGWSRFVKDKKLDAGDIVSFQRGVGDLGKDRLFIDWKRRPDAPDPAAALQHHMPFQQLVPWNPLLMRPPVLPHSQINNFYNRNSYYNASNNLVSPCTLGSVFYLRSQPAATTSVHPQPQMGMVEWRQQQQPIVFDSVPVVQGKVAAKRLRLFGVNMDCPITESDECDIFSSTMAINQTYQPSQLRLYNGSPMPHPIDFLNKGKAPMSFDSGI